MTAADRAAAEALPVAWGTARMALFDGDRQVTPWVPYRADGTARIPITEDGLPFTHVRLASDAGGLDLPAADLSGRVCRGDAVQAAPLHRLFER